jgi:hypothetical protein
MRLRAEPSPSKEAVMPQISNLSVDATALMAVGFLAAILVLTLGLFAWLILQPGKRAKRN